MCGSVTATVTRGWDSNRHNTGPTGWYNCGYDCGCTGIFWNSNSGYVKLLGNVAAPASSRSGQGYQSKGSGRREEPHLGRTWDGHKFSFVQENWMEITNVNVWWTRKTKCVSAVNERNYWKGPRTRNGGNWNNRGANWYRSKLLYDNGSGWNGGC
ncbi:hypothetical protein B0H17DRAFT_1127043 [Mycena rosella]|uniref:Uncharacterized protein n=1 Tax=Mycena rosella TaxID=1033263 RepID=A0AAD7M6U0_MYCRO|nr:hypothetical protein B0H17DRAFT_1127043 [Mycena rosella]